MLEYFITTAIIWTSVYIIYLLFLKQETLFAINRLFLLSGLLIGIMAPFLSNFLSPSIEYIGSIHLNMIEIVSLGPSAEEPTSFSLWSFIIVVYLAGSVIYGVKVTYSWLKLSRLSANVDPISIEGQLVYPSDEIDSPFFWNGKIFIPENLRKDKKRLNVILRHEISHKKYGHHYDQYIMTLSKLIFWWNPLLYFIEKELRLLHEFQADARVCTKYNKKKYGRMLIQYSSQALTNDSVHGIFSHQLKNRLIMLGKKSDITTAIWKYSTAVLLLFVLFTMSIAISPTEVKAQEDGRTFVKADQMPLFPTCKDQPKAEQNKCSNQKLLKFISENIRYPEKAKRNEIEGTVYTSFIVNEEGIIEDIETIKSPDSELSQEARKVILAMNELDERWTPARKGDKAVAVKMNLPINFELPKEEEENKE